MKPISKETTEAILAAAKKEFLSYGFSGASLRRISSDCNVSTHTIYTRFGSKEGLFDSLVKDTAEGLFAIYSASVGRAYSDDYQDAFREGDSGSIACLDYAYRHFDDMKLILRCSAGSKYEHYLDRFVEMEEQYYRDYINGILKIETDIPPFFFHILSKNSVNLYHDVVDNDLSYEEAKDYLAVSFRFTEAGLKEILGIDWE